MKGTLPRETWVYIAAAGLTAAAVAALAAARGWTPVLAGDPLALSLGAAATMGGVYFAERKALRFRWREHRITTALAEVPLLVGLVALPWPLVALALVLARAAIDLVARRPAVKLVFNAASGLLAAAAAGVAFASLDALGVPALLAVLPATALYTLVSDALLAGLFATLESTQPLRVYRERFLVQNAITLAIALPAGIVIIALWTLSPPAVLATLPLAWFLLRHADLMARADREIAVHRVLARVSQELAGSDDEAAIAERVVGTCRDLLDAGRARLSLADGRAWDRAFETSGVDGAPSLTVPVVGKSGAALGELAAWERPAKERYADAELAVMRIIAGQAATALEGARAFAESAAQRDLLARQDRLSALGTLLAGVAHEVSNPLTYMRLRTEIVRKDTEKALASGDAGVRALAEKMEKNIGTIRQGIDRLDLLSQSLKATAKPGDGTRGATDVNEIVAHVVTVLKPGHKEVLFEVDLAKDLASAHANSAEIHQVLFNLAKNAVEALDGRERPTLRLATRRDGNHVVIEVADNGPGIPADAREKLFTPFFTTKKKGTGLGLSISHRIVTAHGGEFSVASETDRGTTFTVRLPLSP